MYRASFNKICSSIGNPNISRLKLSSVGSESCSMSVRDDFVNCAMFTIVVSLCRSFT